MRVTAGTWHGHDSVEYGDGGTTVVVVPGRGAKIVSLTDRTGAEWLLQPADGAPDQPVGPGAAFLDAEMCGWDECAPTIEAARVEPGGAMAPDHGELWNVAWEAAGVGAFRAPLPSLGAEFSRALVVGDDGAVTLRYRAELLASRARAVPLLWAAHPMFTLLGGDRLTIDDPGCLWDVSGATPTRLDRGRGEPSGEYDGLLDDLPLAGGSAKYYADPTARPTWACLTRADGRSLTLSWHSDEIPYLGVWLDRSRFAHADVIALEPCTGWYDSVARADASRRVLRLEPGRARAWTLGLAFSD